jgi:dihydroxy-acid dehydratase
MVGHVAPEAFHGGPLAAVEERDIMLVECDQRKLEVQMSDVELTERLSKVKRPEPRYKTGVFAKYAASVSSAARGAVTVPKW